MEIKDKDDLKIIELRGENFKKIKAIVIRPDDDLVLLTGKNDQGKSSAIDLIIAMLCGKNTKMIPQPIRKGQTHADGRMDLGKFIVTVKWTEKGRYLEVTNAEGYTPPLPPQELLDTFVGEISFDLSKFIEMEDKERTELFLKLAGLDFAPIDQEIDRLVEERRLQGIKTKMFNSQRETFTPELALRIPKELISTNLLNDELEKAVTLNQTLTYADQGIENSKTVITGLLEEVEDLVRQISNVKKEIERHEQIITKEEKYLKDNKLVNTGLIREKIIGAEELNELFRANERNKVADQKFKYELSVYEKQTAKITERRKSKDKALQEAKLPLPGLTVNSLGTFFNDIPINQLSSSEKIKVAMSIAMALNYKLKVILVKEASLLDEENIKVIREMAKGKGYQVWLEKVDKTGEMGFYFVDGMITAVNGQKVVEVDYDVVDAEFEEGEIKNEN